jgi:hypothetical protein
LASLAWANFFSHDVCRLPLRLFGAVEFMQRRSRAVTRYWPKKFLAERNFFGGLIEHITKLSRKCRGELVLSRRIGSWGNPG